MRTAPRDRDVAKGEVLRACGSLRWFVAAAGLAGDSTCTRNTPLPGTRQPTRRSDHRTWSGYTSRRLLDGAAIVTARFRERSRYGLASRIADGEGGEETAQLVAVATKHTPGIELAAIHTSTNFDFGAGTNPRSVMRRNASTLLGPLRIFAPEMRRRRSRSSASGMSK